MRGVTRFGIKGNLALRYARPFEITEKIGNIAYCLRFPPWLGYVHDVFHVSMLKKYSCGPSHILPYVKILLQPDVTYGSSLLRFCLGKSACSITRRH